ncbi:MBL fold metallo-hydrolase [Hymenobacter chitinivorans]|uniref:Glyoxylase-like metal-dependent hydrolase (Beta-lactamase superfamily II) n=1 Tax=Hymenobacter chitinivorans DSM 11115 TaxID=1121954 RepID=A0A2M9BPI9_9BACT|nr:MBL fold metallo-hydrolase [Hymenobacter chitinivorans]PJJ59847.1 glyoxylase-like metal-dependent hydrolase (beta-lactamase superfamily II) [Hymenobacter chitinivorans DSM 11115]
MKQVAQGVHQLTIQRFVNLYFVETGRSGEWVLVDTGLPGAAKDIIAAADKLFYPGTHPEAILLTHGHMDHAGNARELAEHWKVPVLAHPLELPFLTGKAVYPPADPTVERGGTLAFVARFFPPQSFQLSDIVQALPAHDTDPPFLPDWQVIHVPGHAPGQIALFREKDRTLLGADAFATANHESVPSLLLQVPCISVAGAPFNYNWQQVRESVQQLAALRPENIGCGHGPVMRGTEATEGLSALAREFPMPTRGRYVQEPARTDETGVQFVPPAAVDTLPAKLAVIGAGVGLAITAAALLAGKSKNKKGKKAGRRKKNSSYGYASSFENADSYSTGYGEREDGTIVGPGPSRPEWRKGGVGD